MAGESIAVLPRMKKWIHALTYENRSAQLSYQTVCDDYHDFKMELCANRDAVTSKDEKEAYQGVIDSLDRGKNSCHNWVCGEDAMDHFQDLKRDITQAMTDLGGFS